MIPNPVSVGAHLLLNIYPNIKSSFITDLGQNVSGVALSYLFSPPVCSKVTVSQILRCYFKL